MTTKRPEVFTPNAAAVISKAESLAYALGAYAVGTEHILAALVETDNIGALKVLTRSDVDIAALRAAVSAKHATCFQQNYTEYGFTDYRTVLRNWKEAHHEVRFLFCSIPDFGVIDDQHVKVIIDDTFVDCPAGDSFPTHPARQIH